MVRHLLVAALLVIGARPFVSQVRAEQKFPYQAVIIVDEADIRCGPGSQFYVTSRGHKNDPVTVHRHDHGGWYMIAPPPGSFSWIDAALVQRTGSDRGIVTLSPDADGTARAIVQIGSQLSDDHSFYGRELTHGDAVTILGEKTLSDAQGSRRMLKIVPPAQEFRWIKGELLMPVSPQIQRDLATDPYQVPPRHRERMAKQTKADIAAPPLAAPTKSRAELTAPDSVVETAPDEEILADIDSDFSRLEAIDKRYAAMMNQAPAEWDLEPIIRDYQQLKKSASSRLDALIEQRLTIAEKRQEISRHYKSFVQLASETAERDAAILAQQAVLEEPETVPSEPAAMPAANPRRNATVAASPMPTTATEAANDGKLHLDGAGILHPTNAPPGLPRFVLVAPDGRLLAYVEPKSGVSLMEWSGQPTGLIGKRQFDPDLQADRIQVERVVTIQLLPTNAAAPQSVRR